MVGGKMFKGIHYQIGLNENGIWILIYDSTLQ